MTFDQLGIIPPILKALAQEGYTNPTPIQQEAIPVLLQRKDLLGCAQTGTGKTAAFAVPIIQHLYSERTGDSSKKIKALVLTPTRELAAQIGASFENYGAFAGLKYAVIFGGVSQIPQVQKLRAGIDILVATPGRLIDLLGQRMLSLQDIRYFVLDEADRMLDMGFLRDVERVIDLLPAKRQTMLFSATMPEQIERLARKILTDPEKVAVTPVSSTVEAIRQSVYFVNKANKTKLLISLLQNKEIVSALVFSRTKHGANKIARDLERAGEASDVIHANKAQSARQLALARFKSGESRVLVATDIVARGIDIDELSHVFNYDLPEVPEDYVHRIGRTGRAGLGGTAIAFCDESEKKLLRAIVQLTGRPIPEVTDHPYPLVPMESDEPDDRGRRANGQRSNGQRGNGQRTNGQQSRGQRSQQQSQGQSQDRPQQRSQQQSQRTQGQRVQEQVQQGRQSQNKPPQRQPSQDRQPLGRKPQGQHPQPQAQPHVALPNQKPVQHSEPRSAERVDPRPETRSEQRTMQHFEQQSAPESRSIPEPQPEQRPAPRRIYRSR